MSQDELRQEAEAAAVTFLTAFDHLDWAQFCATFAPDATIFMPWASFPKRLDGLAAIEAAFRPLFEQLPRQQAGPRYLHLDPLDLEIKMIGSAALVTFHLDEPEQFCRRTAIFEKRESRWLIVHLHASNFNR